MKKHIIFTDHNNPTLTKFLKEISSFKIYPSEIIVDLIKKAKNGDTKARDEVIHSNLRFVVTMAKKWQGRGVPLMDLISEGTLGLWHALDKFEPERGVPFISYAAHWIKQYIYQSIYWTGKEIRLPVSQHVSITKLLKTESEFLKKHTRLPSSQELSELTGISEEDINYLSQFSNKLVSVDDFLGGDSENNQVCDVIPNDEPLLDESLDNKLLHDELTKIIENLTIREHDIICMTFGINVEQVDSKFIADLFGICTERVRQIKEQALRKIKQRYGKAIKIFLQ